MLTIIVDPVENWDEELQEFTFEGGTKLELEHSLAALSKWESKFEKPFLSKGEKTTEEVLGYIEAMTLTPNTPPELFQKLSEENIRVIDAYINSKASATWFNELKNQGKKGSAEVITSELIYYWMTTANIPLECATWHLNRLFTLIKIHGMKNSKPKKMSQADMVAQRRALNAQRMREAGHTG